MFLHVWFPSPTFRPTPPLPVLAAGRGQSGTTLPTHTPENPNAPLTQLPPTLTQSDTVVP